MFSYLISLLVFIISIGLLILIHELGHFLSAKLFKVKVEEFGFGLPPRLFGRKKGETIYSINAIPAGGFVRLSGEDEETDDPRAFGKQESWKKAVIVTSGVLMNFLFSLLILTFIYTLGGPVSGDRVFIESVFPNSPAEESGLKPGDYVVEFDHLRTDNPKRFSDRIKEKKGLQSELIFERNSQRFAVLVTPRISPPGGQGPLGISTLPDITVKSFPVWEAAIVGTNQAIRWSGLILEGVRDTLRDLIVKREAPTDVGGIIRIGYLTHKATLEGWQPALMSLGIFSLDLAILNILPIPALDGGRLVFIGVEALTKRRVPARIEKSIHASGMALLLLLIMLITYNDIIWIWANTSLKDKIQFLFSR